MAETGWALGDSGPPTAAAMGRCSRPEAHVFARRRGRGGRVVRRHGVRPGPRPLLGTLLDLRSSHPETLSAMRRWTGVADAVHLALTGALRTYHTLAGRSLAYRLPLPRANHLTVRSTRRCWVWWASPGADAHRGCPEIRWTGSPQRRRPRCPGCGHARPVAGHDHQVAAWASGVRCSEKWPTQWDRRGGPGTRRRVRPGSVASRGDEPRQVVDGITEAVLAGSPSSARLLQWMADAETGSDVEQLLSGSAEPTLAGVLAPHPSGRQSPHPDPAASVRRIGPAGDPEMKFWRQSACRLPG